MIIIYISVVYISIRTMTHENISPILVSSENTGVQDELIYSARSSATAWAKLGVPH